jgi:hypothetical protein
MEILGPGVPPVVNVRWPARIPAVAARTRRYNESLLYRAEYNAFHTDAEEIAGPTGPAALRAAGLAVANLEPTTTEQADILSSLQYYSQRDHARPTPGGLRPRVEVGATLQMQSFLEEPQRRLLHTQHIAQNVQRLSGDPEASVDDVQALIDALPLHHNDAGAIEQLSSVLRAEELKNLTPQFVGLAHRQVPSRAVFLALASAEREGMTSFRSIAKPSLLPAFALAEERKAVVRTPATMIGVKGELVTPRKALRGGAMLALVTGNCPIDVNKDGHSFQVRVTKMRDGGTAGLVLGVTSIEPTSEYAHASDVPQSWCMSSTGQFYFTSPDLATRTPLESGFRVEPGDVLGVVVGPDGSMGLSRNREVVIFLPDARVASDQPLYAIVELAGRVDAVSLAR